MGIADRKLKTLRRTHSAKERTYAIFGEKLVDDDSIIFNKFKDESLTTAKTIWEIYFTIYGLAIISVIFFVIEQLNRGDNLSTALFFVYNTFFIVYFIYFVFYVPYLWIGIYSRSWIKLLQHKELLTKITFFQKLTGKYSSILYPEVKSYLETNNISLFISENEIRSVAPLSEEFDKMKNEHIKFDNSIIKFDEGNIH